MIVTFSLKQRNSDTGQWRDLDVNSVAGLTLEQMLATYAGSETVAEFVIGEARFYFCGTEIWRERMARKGRAILFDQALAVLKERCPELLPEVLPHVDTVAGVFEGATLQQITWKCEGVI